MNIKRVAYETKPLSQQRPSYEAWKPAFSQTKFPEKGDFPYQKVFSNVSRKVASQEETSPAKSGSSLHATGFIPSASEPKYGSQNLRGEEVDQLVASFLKERKLV
jgi:hypothetical protein